MPSTSIPEKYLPILTEKKPLAHLAIVLPDGSPQVTPVWFFYKDGKFIVNTARGRVKEKNLKETSRVG